jgi:hypothetical protein
MAVTFENPREEKRCYLDEIAVQSAVVVQRNAYLAGRFGRRRPNVRVGRVLKGRGNECFGLRDTVDLQPLAAAWPQDR